MGVFCVSLLSLIGAATLRLSEEGLQRLINAILPLAVGALLGDALLHLLPDALRTIRNPVVVGIWVLVGGLLFFALDISLHQGVPSMRGRKVDEFYPDNRYGSLRLRTERRGNQWSEERAELEGVADGPVATSDSITTSILKSPIENRKSPILAIGKMSIAANSVHNFVDGVLIAGTFIANPAAGMATLIAVILHEIPHEAANYGILLHANYTRERAIFLNFMVGLVAMAGAITALLIGTRSHVFIAGLLPFTAGCFIYMACADLIPSIAKKHNGRLPLAVSALILVGFGIMGALLFIEPK